jgi:hypothetical protein
MERLGIPICHPQPGTAGVLVLPDLLDLRDQLARAADRLSARLPDGPRQPIGWCRCWTFASPSVAGFIVKDTPARQPRHGCRADRTRGGVTPQAEPCLVSEPLSSSHPRRVRAEDGNAPWANLDDFAPRSSTRGPGAASSAQRTAAWAPVRAAAVVRQDCVLSAKSPRVKAAYDANAFARRR